MNGRAKHIRFLVICLGEAVRVLQFQKEFLQKVLGHAGAQRQPREEHVQLGSISVEDTQQIARV